jgi:hypothetical protein
VINLIHMVQSRGMGSAWRRPQPIAPQPPGISHLTLIEGGGAGAEAARRVRRGRGEAVPPAAPSPGSG